MCGWWAEFDAQVEKDRRWAELDAQVDRDIRELDAKRASSVAEPGSLDAWLTESELIVVERELENILDDGTEGDG